MKVHDTDDIEFIIRITALKTCSATHRARARWQQCRKQTVRFVVIPESKNCWIWELRSAQDFLVLRSPGSFTAKFQAVAQIEALRRAIHVAGIYDLVGARVDAQAVRVTS